MMYNLKFNSYWDIFKINFISSDIQIIIHYN